MQNVIGAATTDSIKAVLEAIHSLPDSLKEAGESLGKLVNDKGSEKEIRKAFNKLTGLAGTEGERTQVNKVGSALEGPPAALKTIMPTEDVATVVDSAMGRTTVSGARNIKPNKATDDTNQSSRNNNISGGQQQEHKVHLTVTAICAGCNNELETKQLTGMSQAHR